MGGGKLRKTEVAPCPDERGDQGAQSLRTLFNIIRRDPRRKDLGSADFPRFAVLVDSGFERGWGVPVVLVRRLAAA